MLPHALGSSEGAIWMSRLLAQVVGVETANKRVQIVRVHRTLEPRVH